MTPKQARRNASAADLEFSAWRFPAPVTTLRIYESRFEAITEQHRSLYVADQTHGWRLACDIDEVCRGLKRALVEERRRAKALENELRTRGVQAKEIDEITRCSVASRS